MNYELLYKDKIVCQFYAPSAAMAGSLAKYYRNLARKENPEVEWTEWVVRPIKK